MKEFRGLAWMFILTTICTTLLVVSEEMYRARMAADPELMRRTVRLLPDLAPSAPAVDSRRAFERHFEILSVPGITGAMIRGRTARSVFVRQQEGTGWLGKITLLVAFDVEKSLVLGLDVLEHGETPGLGAGIVEKPFCEQFRGLPAVPGVTACKVKVRDGEFDGISGATMTSKAVEEIVNNAISEIRRCAAAVGEQR